MVTDLQNYIALLLAHFVTLSKRNVKGTIWQSLIMLVLVIKCKSVLRSYNIVLCKELCENKSILIYNLLLL